ncbi:MAG: hypothetical protein M1840_001927 [Geoglossum simile]|nr:MAG: hypothetical protein M1840_001927 [Geoglossum simile]
MSASVAPSIPPRPVRSQRQPVVGDTPKIPPRPSRRIERSASPKRDSFARSPLNESTFTINHSDNSSSLYSHGQNLSASNLPSPSVTLPSVGQEGTEYSSFYEQKASSEITQPSETQTRNIGSNLKLHAPKPTLPASGAKSRTATVTRTDSTQATAAGIGHADDKDPHSRSLKAKTSFASHDSSQGIERSASTQPSDNEHGIPEIGLRVPMYPNAGDVQAPSPSPYLTSPSGPGIGFHNDGQQRPGRHHKRTLSGRECPPGSYGLHGHGVPNQNKFEKAWYESHPDALEREESGEYGPGLGAARAEWALSSEDLNRVVRETASKGAGYGTSPAIDGTPDEQVGYLASEEYASRITSPNPPLHQQSISNSSQIHSALRLKEDIITDAPLNRLTEDVVADETEDEDVIHVDPLSPSRGDSGAEDLGLQGSNGSEHGGWIDERSYGVPILASDEVAKEPAAEHLQPAVSPYQERRSNGYFTGGDLERSGSRSSSRPTSTPASRSGSRPSSIVGGVPGFTRYSLHDDHEELSTQLEDVEEYEPLFPEDEKGEKPKSTVDRLKRPELSTTKSNSSSTRPQRRKFPSQDIWEDAPSSAQLQATVTNPQLQDDDQGATKGIGESAKPSSGASPSQQQEVEDGEDSSFLPQETRDWANPKYKDEINNSKQKQRFPSKDIWEDSPESLQLQTIVSAPQTDESKGVSSVAVQPTVEVVMDTQEKKGNAKGDEVPPIETKSALEKPMPPRPLGSKEVTVGAAGVQPSIPARPPHRVRNLPPTDIPPMPAKISAPVSSVPQARAVPPPPTRADDEKSVPTCLSPEKKPPVLPERPKPQTPARPAKPVAKRSGDSMSAGLLANAALVSSTEGNSTRSGPIPPMAKPKPAVPSRPNSGKLAAFKAGFFSDLDKRLQQGPTAPKPKPETVEEQIVEEKTPLSDARKGRARGPARRKPAASPSGIAEETTRQTSLQKFDISKTFINWQIAEDGVVFVYSGPDDAPKVHAGSLGGAGIDPTHMAPDITGEKIFSFEDTTTRATNSTYLPDETPDTTRLAEDEEEKPDLVRCMSTEVQSVDSIAGERSAEEGQDQDPTFETDINVATVSPIAEAAAAADEPADPSRGSDVELKGVSVASEPIQANEQGVHTNLASTIEIHAATIGKKAPEEGNAAAKENATQDRE